MEDRITRASIIFYSIINLIYCIVFIAFIGSFLVALYGFLITQLLFNFLT